MPARTPDHKRAAILTDVRSGGTCRSIAVKHGVSRTTVSNLAKESGIEDPFGRQQTQKATEAKAIDHKARLVAIAGRSAGLAERILGSFEDMSDEDWADVSPYTRGLVFGIASDKAKDLASDDTGAEQVASALGKFFDGIVERYGDDYGAA